MKVYLVGVGDYSYYNNVAAFSSRKRADEVAELIGGDVEVFEVKRKEFEDPGMDFFEAELTRTGECHVVKRSRLDEEGNRRKESSQFRTKKDEKWERRSYWRLYVHRYAESEEEVVKFCEDLRSRILDGERPEGVDMGEN